MRWSHTAVTASCAANGQTDRPKLKLVPFVGVTAAGSLRRSRCERGRSLRAPARVWLPEKVSQPTKKKSGSHSGPKLGKVRHDTG